MARHLGLFDRTRKINNDWQDAYVKAQKSPNLIGSMPHSVVIGIDLGGSNLRWTAYPVHLSGIVNKEIANGRIDLTEDEQTAAAEIEKGIIPERKKGIVPIADAYAEALTDAMNQVAALGGVVVGVGVCSPGRFVTKGAQDQFLHKRGPEHKFTSHVGNMFSTYTNTQQWPWHEVREGKSKPVLSAAYALGMNIHEFDSVALESMLQRLSPDGVQVVVRNDATVQMKGLAAANKVKDKKTIYIGSGTGLGAGVMTEDGSCLTDAHFQFIRLPKRKSDGVDVELFDFVRQKHHADYIQHEKPVESILPQDVVSSTAVSALLKDKVFPEYAKEEDKEFGRILDELYAKKDDRMEKAIPYLQSVGRYMGDMMVALHKGEFHHMNRDWEWDAYDKKAVKGYETVIIGGGFGKTPIFREVILPEAKKVLAEHGIKDLEYVQPEKAEAAAMFAAAQLVSSKALTMPVDALWKHQQSQLATPRTM